MSKYKDTLAKGTVHRVRDGLLQVEEYENASTVHVVFMETGSRQVARAHHIIAGSVKDRMKKPKRERIRQAKRDRRKLPRFIVLTNDDTEMLFNSVPEIADHFGCSQSTVYTVMRKEVEPTMFKEVTRI